MKKTALLVFIFAVLISSMAFAQSPVFKISGKVINGKTGEPIEKASVSFQPMFLTVYIEPAITGPDGSYSIGLTEGAYYVIVKHPDYEAYVQKEIKISSGLTMDFKLLPPLPPIEIKNYVMGTVLEKGSGQPVSAASVNLLAADGRKIYIGAASDKMGNFVINNIPEGDYYFNVSKMGYFPYKDTAKLTIKPDTRIQDIKISLQKDTAYSNTLAKSLKFYIYKIDASGSKSGIVKAKILLSGAMGMQYEGITDENGVFILTEAAKGMYKVIASDGSNTAYTAIDIKNDGQTFEIEIKPPVPVAQGTIKGKVTNSVDASPVWGATVYVIPAGETPPDPVFPPKPAIGTVSGANGEYSLSVVPGDYYVGCNFKSKYETFAPIAEYYDNARRIEDAKKITVTKDGVVSGINFSLDVPVPQIAEVAISGKIITASGDPVKEAKLVVYERTNDRQIGTLVKILSDGKYYGTIKLEKGHHELVIGVYGINYQPQFYNGKSSLYEADVIKLDITGDKATVDNIDFRVYPYDQTGSYSISGRVVDEAQNPVMGVYVELFGSFNKAVMALTDSLGSYTISGLPMGKYFVGFFAKGYMPQFYKDALIWEKAVPVELTSSVKGIDAVIKKTEMNAMNGSVAGTVTGKVLGQNNVPVGDVRIILTTSDGKIVAADVSDAQGGYCLSGVPAGSYKLIASKVNYQSVESELNIALDKSSSESLFNINLNSATTGLKDNNKTMKPARYVLENNYPNPFNPSTRIRFALPEAVRVSIDVYSILGQKISTLVDEEMSAGYHEVTFNAAGLSSGTYIYKMSSGSFTESKLMHLLK